MNFLDSMCNLYRGCGRTALSLIGLKKISFNQWDYSSLITASWVFLLGLPIGSILLNLNITTIPIWFVIVLIGLVISNLDDAYKFARNSIKYGVDGVCNFSYPPYGD